MSGQRVWIDRHPVITPDEVYTSPVVSVPNNNVQTLVCSLQIRWGARCWLVGLGSAVDAGGVGFTTLSLQKNYVPLYPFHSATSQWGSITAPMRMVNAYQIEQGSLLQIYAAQTGGTGATNVAGRIMVEYEDF